MKKLLVGLLLFTVIFFTVWLWSQRNTTKAVVHVGPKTLQVEVASTIPQITKGLGDRDAIGSDGMLFVLPNRQVPSFWMQGMRFGLDFVWIDEGRVVAVTPDVPDQQGVPANQLAIYRPPALVDHVLEIDAGNADRWGIKVGDKVQY